MDYRYGSHTVLKFNITLFLLLNIDTKYYKVMLV